MEDFIQTLTIEFERNANEEIAEQQKAYMRNKFEFYGMKAPLRRQIQKPFLVKNFLAPKSELATIVKILWAKPQRDYHHFAMDLSFKYIKQLELNDIALFEFMVTNQSWWDTVDFIAVKLMGGYFKVFPDQRKVYIKKWLASNNIWLQRSALLFQLKYKKEIDTEIMSSTIQALLGSKEFFINKAIGWLLREYSRTDPNWVIDFVNKTDLQALSKREALRLLAK